LQNIYELGNKEFAPLLSYKTVKYIYAYIKQAYQIFGREREEPESIVTLSKKPPPVT
jgi:hypothetical protein